MASPSPLPTLAATSLYEPATSSVFSSVARASVSIPLSTQSAPLSTETWTTAISSISDSSSSIPSDASIISPFATPLSSQVSPISTTSSDLPTSNPSSISSDQSTTTIPIPWIIVIAVFSLAILLLIVGIYRARRRTINIEAGLASSQGRNSSPARPRSTANPTPGLIRRTTTSRIRDDWQQWIAKPPPPLSWGNSLRRRDSAVMFSAAVAGVGVAAAGAGGSGRLSCEPLLTAHEVEVSGVLWQSTTPLATEIEDPPPAYTPRRY